MSQARLEQRPLLPIYNTFSERPDMSVNQKTLGYTSSNCVSKHRASGTDDSETSRDPAVVCGGQLFKSVVKFHSNMVEKNLDRANKTYLSERGRQ